MVSSRNIYEITLNDEPINISLGPAFVEKLQEPLDEGAINLPLEVYDYEFEMFGILNIRMIGEFKEKTLTYFITSDSVEPESKDGYYNHKLSLIEYTALYDTILVETLTFTKK